MEKLQTFKFRASLDYNDSINREYLVSPLNNFYDFHLLILSSFSFDKKHQASFYRSDESRKLGKPIAKDNYELPKFQDTLMMDKVKVGEEINTLHQKFIFHYDFQKNWVFYLDLLGVQPIDEKEISSLPKLIKSSGLAPEQYDTKSSVEDFLEKIKKEAKKS